MPDFLADEDEEIDDTDLLLETYVETDILADMDEEELEALRALMAGDTSGLPSEEELVLMDVYLSSAPEPSQAQRLAHFETLKQAEQQGQRALLMAFAKGPVAAHALYDIDMEQYDEMLIDTLGAYWSWAHGLDEATIRSRIVNDEFHEAFFDVLEFIGDEQLSQTYPANEMKGDESDQD